MMITRVLTIALLATSLTATTVPASAAPPRSVNHSLPEGEFNAISQSSADDVWAVGAVAGQAVAVRFDGKRWRDLRLDDPGTLDLRSVAATGHQTAWALGYRGGQLHAIRLKKNKIDQEYPLPSHDVTNYRHIDARGDQAFVFVGDQPTTQPYAYQFVGDEWRRIEIPMGDGESVRLTSAAVADNGDVWFTGSVRDAEGTRILVARERHGVWERAELPDRPDQPGDQATIGDQVVSANGRIHVRGHSPGFRHTISYYAVLTDGVWTAVPLTGVSGTMHGIAVADNQAWLAGGRRSSRSVALVYRQDDQTWTEFGAPENLLAGNARSPGVSADANGAWELINATKRGKEGEHSGNIIRIPRSTF